MCAAAVDDGGLGRAEEPTHADVHHDPRVPCRGPGEDERRRRPRHPRHRGRRDRGRRRTGGRHPRAARRHRGGPGLGQRDVEPLHEARPRRPALRADARLPPRPRGPHRARPAHHPARTPPGQARGVPPPPGAPDLAARLLRGGRRPLRHPGDCLRAPAGPALPPAPVAQGSAPQVPRPAPRCGRGGRPVLGRLRRRRPAGPHPGPHGGRLRCARRLAHPARGAHEERGRSGGRCCGRGPRDRPRARGSVPVR